MDRDKREKEWELAFTVCFFAFLCRKVDAFDSGRSPGRGNDTLMMIAFNQCAPRNTEIPIAIIYRIHGVRSRLFNPVCAEERYLNSVLREVANTDPYQSYGLLESYRIEYLSCSKINIYAAIHTRFHGTASCKGSEIRVAQGKGYRPPRISSTTQSPAYHLRQLEDMSFQCFYIAHVPVKGHAVSN